MDAEWVLREAAELGLRAVEAGPEGFLPPEPAGASRWPSLPRAGCATSTSRTSMQVWCNGWSLAH